MSKRIPATYKTELGEFLAKWYRHFGKVAPRRAYHEDDEGSAGAPTSKMFEDHPFLAEMPIGAPSDLASTIIEDARTLDEADERKDELKNELQNKLTMRLENKLENKYRNEKTHKFVPPTPRPF